MDNTKIKAGATLYLPVFHEGALLAMGDVHACMGDGEIMVTGLEIPAEVTVTLEVLKGISIDNPMPAIPLRPMRTWRRPYIRRLRP